MALNNNGCLLLAMMVMVSSNAVVNGQPLINDISPNAAANAESAVNEWKIQMMQALLETLAIQLVPIRNFVVFELPSSLDTFSPELKNPIIDACQRSTIEVIQLLDGAIGLREMEDKQKLVRTLADAENIGRRCIYELTLNNVDVSNISDLVAEYETALRKAMQTVG